MSMREVKVCLLGEAGVGKSSIAHRFVMDSFNEKQESTIGAAFMSKTVKYNTQTVKFQMWDTAGQEKYKGLAPMYYRGASAAIVVYDITSFNTYNVVKDWVRDVRDTCDTEDFILIIVGNKVDVEEKRNVPRETAEKYCVSMGAHLFECSALSGKNVFEIFEKIAENLPSENPMLHHKRDTINIRPPIKEKKKECCKTQ
ncbi:Ras-related protein Rab-22A-like [Oopsacas minuta]|uniref:Ras-related protein Rab-22A-like n=1 Tax=Oopsacas minuta TaxID=111878 RepID=A0AAV7JQD4_9METZ|nr:Ras-related protein Rab-22A-like [Oopsacas minuta]